LPEGSAQEERRLPGVSHRDNRLWWRRFFRWRGRERCGKNRLRESGGSGAG